MEIGGAVYILTNKSNNVLYTGVTSNLKARIFEHKEKTYPNSFSAKYNTNKLVYFIGFNNIEDAVAEEKRIKGGSRTAKIKLIESINLEWNDLFSQI